MYIRYSGFVAAYRVAYLAIAAIGFAIIPSWTDAGQPTERVRAGRWHVFGRRHAITYLLTSTYALTL